MFVLALVLSGVAQAQSNEELKGLSDQALTIQGLEDRVKAPEQQKQPAPGALAPTAAKAPSPEQPSTPAPTASGRAGRYGGEGRRGAKIKDVIKMEY